MKKGDYLICKNTYYNNDRDNLFSMNPLKLLNRLFKKPLYIKNKKYLIHKIDDPNGSSFQICVLLECEFFNRHNQLYIYGDTVKKIFYTEQELRKQKLKKLKNGFTK